jgi:hypothetical protein
MTSEVLDEEPAPEQLMLARQERCRTCSARIVWARPAFSNSAIPLDPVPVADGNILVNVKGNRLMALVLPPGDERIGTDTTYTTHFATCPDAEHWRRRHA